MSTITLLPFFFFLDAGLQYRLGSVRKSMTKPSKWIRDPQDIYDIEIPARLKSVPIEWAEKWKKVPLLHRSVRDSIGKVFISLILSSTCTVRMESITRSTEILTSTNTTSVNCSSQFDSGIVEAYGLEEPPQPRTVPGGTWESLF
jgi:hypothetical protein